MLMMNRKLSQNGFSLIELMIAVTILAMAIFGIFHAYSIGFLGMADARDRTVATNHVQEKMEELKNADFDTVVDEASSQIVGNIKFSRSVNVEYIDGSTNLIIAEPTNLKRVTTTVNWTDRNGVTKKVESSLLLQNTQYTPGDASRISLYADPYNMVLPGSNSTTIIAVIKDKSGNTISDWDGSDVTFTIISELSVEGVPLTGQLGTLSDYAVTPVKGMANVVFTSSAAELEGTVTVEASVTTSISDGLNTFTDTIDIKVEGGTHVITFTVDGEGTLISLNPAASDSGIATITLQSTLTAGIATVTAESPGLFSGSCDVRTSGVPAGIALSASPNPMYSDDISTVTVTIVDENGVPVIPATEMIVGLDLSGSGVLSDYSLDFNDVSVHTINYTHLENTEEIVRITATGGSFTEDIYISVKLKLDAHHIELNADPFSIPADEGISTSTITATVKNTEDITVHNYNDNLTFLILTGLGGTLSSPDVTCFNGVATIQLNSGAIPGTCQIQVQDKSGLLPAATINVGFYKLAHHINLTAVPAFHIPVGGGNEGTSKLTASIVDEANIIVYNYEGHVRFSFSGGYNELIARFKYVDQPNYIVQVSNGSASIYLLSLNNSGDAVVIAEEYPFSGSVASDELTLYIQKVLTEPDIPHIDHDANGKGVDFDIEVLGGDMQINKMNVSWLPDSEENQLLSIKFPNGVVFSGSIPSGQDIDITDIDITDRELLEGTSTIHLGFAAGITDQDITVIFYPSTSDYHAESYTINF